MMQIILSSVFIVSSIIAYRAGHKKHWIIIALILALSFQYVFHFSIFGQTICAVIFVLYFALPNARLGSFRAAQQNTNSTTQNTSPPRQKARATNSSKAQSVFEDFNSFTKSMKSKSGQQQKSNSSAKKQSSKSSQKTSRRSSNFQNSSTKSSKHRSSKTRSTSRDNLKKAQAQIVAAQHAIQTDKELLKEKEAQAKKKIADEKRKFEKEKARLKAEQDALKKQQQSRKPKSQSDNRSPEKIMGISNPFTKAELKEAYKYQTERWNPSNMAGKPQHLIDEAEEEFRKIIEANKVLKKRL